MWVSRVFLCDEEECGLFLFFRAGCGSGLGGLSGGLAGGGGRRRARQGGAQKGIEWEVLAAPILIEALIHCALPERMRKLLQGLPPGEAYRRRNQAKEE